MHIAMFLDQHPDTLGGAQLSVALQVKYLRLLGHTVTICAPGSKSAILHDDTIIFPSRRIGFTGEYEFAIPSPKLLGFLDRQFESRPKVDVVHVQGDFWGAALGFAFAKRHQLPSIVTFHNNVEVGTRHVLGKRLAPLYIRWASRAFGKLVGHPTKSTVSDGWKYLAQLGAEADIRLAPTAHFARDLEARGVTQPVGVLSNGLDDDMMASIKPEKKPRQRPLLIWTGRLSKEKRLLEFLQAVRASHIDADIAIYGTGDLRLLAERYVKKVGLSQRVKFHGAVSGKKMLQAIANADAVIQTSIGFETQGRTVFEALAFGVPVLLSDPAIAEDFTEDSFWLVEDSSIGALADSLQTVVSSVGTKQYKKPHASVRKQFLQSTLAKEMADIYQKAVKHHAKDA